jgi:uncharacterized Tic20 family protein
MNSGSTKAMLVHLSPMLLPVLSTVLSPYLIPESSGQPLWYLIFLVPALIIFLPAIILRLSSKSTDFERRHASAYLNFEISSLLYVGALVGTYLWILNNMSAETGGSYQGINSPIALLSISFALLLLSFTALIVAFNVRAAIAAYKGQEYRYPIAIRFLK